MYKKKKHSISTFAFNIAKPLFESAPTFYAHGVFGAISSWSMFETNVLTISQMTVKLFNLP